jgi:DNA-binding LytR/AlgR family response regulator
MTAVIIEDERLVAKELQAKIAAVADDVEIIEQLTSLKTARRWFMQNAEPDLIFMDIQLSDGASFELFETYQLSCPVIFTTAYDEYAIRAFKANGIDYLLKPVDEEELKQAIAKCRGMLNKKSLPDNVEAFIRSFQLPAAQKSAFKEKFIIHRLNNWVPVDTRDIACFTRENLNYLFTFNNEKYILDYSTLEDIEELLDPAQFYRANRQTIININSIQSVKPHENQKLTVKLKPPLKMEVDVSREKAPAFKKWFDR